MAEKQSSFCKFDLDMRRFEQLAKNDKSAGKSAFHRELDEFLKPLGGQDAFYFLDSLRDCFDAERKLHPKLDLPKFEHLPHAHEII